MKHTPGAWRIGFVSTTDDGECFLISGPRGTALDIAIIPKGNDEARANTHLIAAAPDYDIAARAVVTAWDESETGQLDGALIESLRAAIAKAEGNG